MISLAGLALVIAGCAPMLIAPSVRGRVIDADTGQPVAGAAVELVRSQPCGIIHGGTGYTRPWETRTDARDRFALGGGVVATACGALVWDQHLVRILAPGYHQTAVDPEASAEPVRLDPLRFAVELAPYRTLSPQHAQRWHGPPGPVWQQTARDAAGVRVRDLDDPGVFARVPGAAFEDVVALTVPTERPPGWGTVVIARDRVTGRLHGWTGRGRPLALVLPAETGWAALAAGGSAGARPPGPVYPLLLREGALHHPTHRPLLVVPPPGSTDPHAVLHVESWTTVPAPPGPVPRVGHLLGPRGGPSHVVTVSAASEPVGLYTVQEPGWGRDDASRARLRVTSTPPRTLAAVFPGATPPIECLAPLAAVGLVALAPTPEGRALFVLPGPDPEAPEPAPAALVAQRVPARIAGPVTACAGGRALALAGPDGVIVTLRLERARGRAPEPGARWTVQGGPVLRLPEPRAVTGLAASALEGVGEDAVLYAVAGTDVVYRGATTGVLDQRIAVDAASR